MKEEGKEETRKEKGITDIPIREIKWNHKRHSIL